MMAAPPRCRGSMAACSRDDPSPQFSSPTATHRIPLSLYQRASSGSDASVPVSMLTPWPGSSAKALIAPRKRLSEMLSRWPRKRSHGPAWEMWSVVHLPLALSRTGMRV